VELLLTIIVKTSLSANCTSIVF